MEVAGAIDGGDVDENDAIVAGFEEGDEGGGFVELIGIGGVEIAFAEATAAIDDAAGEEGAVVGGHVDGEVAGEGVDLVFEAGVEFVQGNIGGGEDDIFDFGIAVGPLFALVEVAEGVGDHLGAHAVGHEPDSVGLDFAGDEVEGVGEGGAGGGGDGLSTAVTAHAAALVSGPVEHHDGGIDVEDMGDEGGHAERSREGVAVSVDEDEKGAMGGGFDLATDVFDEGLLIEGEDIVDLEGVVLEPIGGIDDHAKSEG